ncbi:hypothetical protein BZA05DRAFT_133642 [Tricharina praecox]|uniref:uncharacterized protein n=1 Tax=Tricharina praecox TaxID=43433 RepID=UPI0022209FC7|nr:uncharacterized protein BZA05DRAFT_133642 [Tricharina praecox]KAI5846678.1 hypothetical protein BZA05DRAFT_133642 [Tricharina praecox]
MAASRDGLPYGSRWGFRTPSPDFARTAVEPLSPPAATPAFAARSSSFSNPNYPPPPTTYSSYSPQYPPVSRSSRDPEPAFHHPSPRAPSPAPNPYNHHGYSFAPPNYKLLPKAAPNPLDALADIALMHGAGRLPSGPTYNPPPLLFPTMASPSPPVATAVMVSPSPSWQRPDSALPPTMPTSKISMERIIPHAKPAHEHNFGPIGQERRSVSGGRERRNSAIADAPLSPPSPAAVRLLPMKSRLPLPDLPRAVMEPLPVMEPLSARLLPSVIMMSEPAPPAEIQLPQPGPTPEELRSRYPWINASPVDMYMDSSNDGEDDEDGFSIAVMRPGDMSKAFAQYYETPAEGFLDVDVGKSKTTSLPTPSQDDHVIGSPSDVVMEDVDEAPRVNDSAANFTPEIAEDESPAEVAAVVEDVATVNTEAGELMEVDEKMATDPPAVDATSTEPDSNYGTLLSSKVPPESKPDLPQPLPSASDESLDVVDPMVIDQDVGDSAKHTATAGVEASVPTATPVPDEEILRNRRSSSRLLKSSEPKKNSRKPKEKSVPEHVGAASGAQRSDNEEDCQTCKVHYSEDDGRNGAWIGCDGCKGWHHARCVKLDQAAVDKIDKFYCVSCEPTHGKSTLKRSSGRARTAIDYEALHHGSSAPVKNPDDARIHPYIRKILDKGHPFAEDNLKRLRPELVTAAVIDSNDAASWKEPFIVPAKWNPTPWHNDPKAAPSASLTPVSPGTSVPPPPPAPANGTKTRLGSPASKSRQSLDFDEPIQWARREDADALDMRIPSGLTVRRVAEMVGVNTTVPMMDVVTQEPPKEPWTMGRLADYFESPEKDTIYNCISCEVSTSQLGEMISRPRAVRETDLADRVWDCAPGFAKPTVGKYVLMSVKDSFTDFHVDFGGSSVFYHIYEGQKVFLVLPPTEKALKTYEKWSSSESMNYTFLPDLLPDIPCRLITLNKGDTFFIPSGWIHAVYTPVDSLVIGGNFLTRGFYINQMRVYNIEAVTGVPKQMRYPRYATLMWAVMFNYIEKDRMPRNIEKDILTAIIGRKHKLRLSQIPYSVEELKGLPSLLDFLHRNVMITLGVITTSQRPGATRLSKTVVDNVKKAVPWPVNRNPLLYLKHFARWCIWKRACADIVPGGEKVPDWAQVEWMPTPMGGTTDMKVEEAEGDGEGAGIDGETPRRGGLRERSKPSVSPEDNLEDFNYFPERLLPVVAGLNGTRRSSSMVPGKRSATPTPGPSSLKKPKTTRRNRNTTPAPSSANSKNHQVEYLKLTDGSLYVKKLSNLGPPRIGCESCRLKKTGCKHKDEIRARGWCDDDRATTLDPESRVDMDEFDDDDEPMDDTPSKPAPVKASPAVERAASPLFPAPKFAAASSSIRLSVPPEASLAGRRSQTPAKSSCNSKATALGSMGPPAGYKGRKPSCEDCKALKKKCLHQDTWKLVQDKQAAAEYKKVLKKHGIENRRQAKESKRKATVARQREGAVTKSVTPVPVEQESADSAVLRAPPLLVPIQPAPPRQSKTPIPVPGTTKEPVEETVVETAMETVEEPVKEAVKEAVNEVVKEAVKEPAKKPVKESVKVTVKETVKEQVKEPAEEPVKEEEEDDEEHKEEEPVKELSPIAKSVRVKRPLKHASPARPSSRSKRSSNVLSPSNDVARLDLDLSILAEEQQFTSGQGSVEPALDPSITAPPIEIEDTPPKTRKAQQPRTIPGESSPTSPSTSPSMAQNDIQREYIAALHQRAKVTYTNTNRSIKRKAEEESPEQPATTTSSSRRVKKEVVVGDGKTTFENLRQLSLGLRVRGQRGGEVC